MKPIAKIDDFELFERDPSPDNAWRNFKLVRSGKGHPKKNWILGWNGQRLADGKDRKTLAEHNPEIERWVVETLSPPPHTTGH